VISEDQPIGDVSIGGLNRHTSDTLKRVEGGERVIVTNHGRPVAVMLPIDDGLDVLLAHLAMEPVVRSTRRLSIRLSAKAANQLDELTQRRRGMLMAAIRRQSIYCGGEGPVAARTPQDLAAGVALVEQEVLLVYYVMPRRDATQRLIGAELADSWNRRNSGRLHHGRSESFRPW
jgi:prevent-host-death family protein